MSRMERLLAWAKLHKLELLLVAGLLTVAGIAHGYNMFHYPYYESDEGTYMAQAWALLTKGELAPYTYWYDHAPAGWILIALWAKLTGGFFTFGFSINSGRVLMLVLHVLSALFLYLIARKLSDNRKIVGAMAVLLFSLSPLAIYFQRRVLLDNIMVFWLLSSIVLLLYYRHKLRYVLLSAVAFGIAALSKETAVFFIPVCLYILFRVSHKGHRKFALIGWIGVTGLVISLYAFYALLKGEFFASGTLLGGSQAHVSLLETLKFQSGRTGGGPLATGGGSFYANFLLWCKEDPLIMFGGAAATIATLLVGIRRRSSLIVGLLALSMWVFMLRGGLVLEFYVIPLLPFLALAIAYSAWLLAGYIRSSRFKIVRLATATPYLAVLAMLVLMAAVYSQSSDDKYSVYRSDQTTPQKQVVDWLLAQQVPGQFYAIDMYGYIDIHEKGTANNFQNAEYYWKVDGDPAIQDKILNDRFSNIDYLIMTPQMQKDLPNLPLVSAAAKNGLPVVSFEKDGWRGTVLATRSAHQQLSASWESYKKTFVQNGKTVDLQANNKVTSQAQAAGMLRAVWMNDKASFASLYAWTSANLAGQDGTFQSIAGQAEQRSDSGADSDIAMALLFAGRSWNNQEYTKQAQQLIGRIWNSNVKFIGDAPYMAAGNWAETNDYLTINPSALSPAAYRMFAAADSTHDWNALVGTSYDILQKCSAANLNVPLSAGLPPERCRLLKADTAAVAELDEASTGSEYSFDALRTPWRIALDYNWYQSDQAKQYLGSLQFLGYTYAVNQKLLVGYTHDGLPWQNYESVIAYGGAMGYLSVKNPDMAKRVYDNNLVAKYYQNTDRAYWEDPNNLYAQNWAWFGTALYDGKLPNLAASK